MAIHPLTGEVYVAGFTDSPMNTFPGAASGAYPGFAGGAYDGFISRFNADLTTRLGSTYLGAGGSDQIFAIAIHPVSGDVYVAGATNSPTTPFPGVLNGGQASSGGGNDAFVSRLSADLGTLRQSTYLGSAAADFGRALAIHPLTGDIYVAGSTDATTNTFPGAGSSIQSSSGGGTDAFVSRFNADLTSGPHSSYLGANGNEEAYALAIHPVSGEVYVAGSTTSAMTTFPGVSGGYQGSY